MKILAMYNEKRNVALKGEDFFSFVKNCVEKKCFNA